MTRQTGPLGSMAKRRNSSRNRKPRSRNDTPPPGDTSASGGSTPPDLLAVIGRGVVPPVLNDPARREEMGLPADDDTPGRYMVELNILYRGGLRAAAKAFRELCADDKVLGPAFMDKRPPNEISKSYFQVSLSVREWRVLLKADEERAKGDTTRRVIYKLWPDFKVKALIDRSIPTVKADAAFKSYSATGAGITWAVIDSGIDGTHPHFGNSKEARASTIYHPHVAELHRDFVDNDKNPAAALRDDLGHGTHVAGIIAGRLPEGAVAAGAQKAAPVKYAVFEQVFE